MVDSAMDIVELGILSQLIEFALSHVPKDHVIPPEKERRSVNNYMTLQNNDKLLRIETSPGSGESRQVTVYLSDIASELPWRSQIIRSATAIQVSIPDNPDISWIPEHFTGLVDRLLDVI